MMLWTVRRQNLWRKLALLALVGLVVTWGAVRYGSLSLFASGRIRPIQRGETSETVVALTFDLAWGDAQLRPILETLRQEGVKATFFVTGSWAATYPELGQRLVADGHEVATLGLRQRSMAGRTSSEISSDLGAAVQSITAFGAPQPVYFRPPYCRVSRKMRIASHSREKIIRATKKFFLGARIMSDCCARITRSCPPWRRMTSAPSLVTR